MPFPVGINNCCDVQCSSTLRCENQRTTQTIKTMECHENHENQYKLVSNVVWLGWVGLAWVGLAWVGLGLVGFGWVVLG